MTSREFHWKVTGWRADAIVFALLLTPFGLTLAVGYWLGQR